jgi:hypothetical protein
MFISVAELCWASSVKNAVFWDVAPCRSCVNRRFGGTYRLHHQGRKIRERGTSVSRWLLTEWCASPKRRFTQNLHGATSKKTALFIVTAVKTSNLTSSVKFTSGLPISSKLILKLSSHLCLDEPTKLTEVVTRLTCKCLLVSAQVDCYFHLQDSPPWCSGWR